MRKEKLSSHCTVKNGYAFKSNDYVLSGYRVIRITNVQKGIVADDDPKFVPDTIADKANSFKLKTGDILISLTGNVGRVGRIQEVHLPAVLNQRVGLIRPSSRKINDEFLFQYLNSDYFETEAIKNANGVAQLNLSSKWLENHLIPLPPLNDQIRIAYLLGKVEGLIASRKQHLQQLDELLKSVFVEMFGFQDGTCTQWAIGKLSLYSDVVSGVTKGKKYAAEELVEVPYMRVANVQDGHFFLDEIKKIAVTQKEINRYQLRRGDLLLTEGGDPDKLGRGSVWEEQVPNCIHQNHIFRVRINDEAEINPYYLSALVGSRYGKAYFIKSAKQTTGIASINSTQLKNFPTVLPPIALQNQFAAIVEKVESLKTRYQQSLADLDALYGTLSQKAFNGELDLSRVPLPAMVPEEEKAAEAQVVQDSTEGEGAFRLPNPGNLPATLDSPQARKAVIIQWLNAYCNQLGSTPFSLAQIIEEIQTRLMESYPDAIDPDNELTQLTNDYDAIKEWVFKALEEGSLVQTVNQAPDGVQLKAVQP